MISEFIPAILLGIVLSFTIGPVFFTILEISVSKGFKAAVFFNIGVVFSEVVFFGGTVPRSGLRVVCTMILH